MSFLLSKLKCFMSYLVYRLELSSSCYLLLKCQTYEQTYKQPWVQKEFSLNFNNQIRYHFSFFPASWPRVSNRQNCLSLSSAFLTTLSSSHCIVVQKTSTQKAISRPTAKKQSLSLSQIVFLDYSISSFIIFNKIITMDPLLLQATKAAADLIKIQGARIDDIMQLKSIIKLQQKQKTRTSHTTQSIVQLCKKEQGRRAQENEALRVFSAKLVGSPHLSKAIQQMHKKVEQIAQATQNCQLALLSDVKADSYAHCEQIMEEEIDYIDRSSAVLAQFSALGSVAGLQNQQYLHATQKFMQQLRQRFNSVVAVSESRREAALFFGDPDISNTLTKLQGESLKLKQDRFDRDVSLPLVIKTSFYDKMMLHNKQLAIELKARYAQRKHKTQSERPCTLQTQNNSEQKQFKGLETLKMLEKQLGLQETQLKELNPFAKRNQIFNDTTQSFYSTNQFLATSDNFQTQKPHNYVHSIQEQYMRQLEDQYKFLQSTKKAKMLQVVNACRRIQRYWRKFKQAKWVKSAIVIQRFFRYRQLLQRKKWVLSSKQSKLGRVRRMMAGLKIKRWLVTKLRKIRQKPKSVKYPKSHINNLIRLQAVFRGYLARKSNLWRQIYRERKHVLTTKMFKKYLRIQKPISVLQSKQMSVLSESVSRRETLDEYIVKAIAEFEAGWVMHEQKLKKYELTQAKLTDWEEKKLPEGKYWLNIKTGEQTAQHPGFSYFKINRKSMRKRAEEKFQRDVINPLEYERERMSIKSEKQLTSLLNDIVAVYKFNVHKIYLH